MDTETITKIENWLISTQASPEQIAGRLKVEGYKNAVSNETIYTHIWNDKRRGGALYKHLRHSGKKRYKRSSGKAGRGCIPGRIDIAERRKEVEEKVRIGDWEGDTILAKDNAGAIVSMVDRASKLTKLRVVKGRKAAAVTEAIFDIFIPIIDLVKTITLDNGKEFSQQMLISKTLDAGIYFARPYHSWERGLNEHTNGLVRQYLPKSSRFTELTPEKLQEIEDKLNDRPRKVLGYQTPREVFNRLQIEHSTQKSDTMRREHTQGCLSLKTLR
jgi:IS30 family transposase